MTDEEAVLAECRSAQAEGREVSDACARTIASWWHSGQASLGYRFVSTGAITTPCDDLLHDLLEPGDYAEMDADDRLCADMLATYCLNRDDRGPVAGWSNLWVR